MRAFLIMVLILLYAYACMHPESATSAFPESNSVPKRNVQTFDSSVYVGDVKYYPTTDEFYTALFPDDAYADVTAEGLETLLDSVIEEQDHWSRERLPLEEARNFFVLAGLDTLSVYRSDHRPVCGCPLVRIEHLWDGMEDKFVAVYVNTGGSVDPEDRFYGVGQTPFPVQFPAFAVRVFQDSGFDAHLMDALRFQDQRNWSMRHYALRRPPLTYSIVSGWSAGEESVSYLTIQENDAFRILNEERNDFHYLGIRPVPILVNGKPLLLMSAGYPFSDVAWEYLAAYDGTGYDAVRYNRIRLHPPASLSRFRASFAFNGSIAEGLADIGE